MPGVLLALAATASAGPPAADPRLSATLVGRLEPGAGSSTESLDICAWQPGFTVTDLDGRVAAMSEFDDGSGPALYVGGQFTYATGLPVNNIARWDGNAWSALGAPSGTGMNSEVYALAVFDDGSGPALYAGGSFTTAGGLSSGYIAEWRSPEPGAIFADGFEQGDTAAWSSTKP